MHAPVVGVAHVVVGSGVLGVQALAVEVIFYSYCRGGKIVKIGKERWKLYSN